MDIRSEVDYMMYRLSYLIGGQNYEMQVFGETEGEAILTLQMMNPGLKSRCIKVLR